jgi:hypothetical protein
MPDAELELQTVLETLIQNLLASPAPDLVGRWDALKETIRLRSWQIYHKHRNKRLSAAHAADAAAQAAILRLISHTPPPPPPPPRPPRPSRPTALLPPSLLRPGASSPATPWGLPLSSITCSLTHPPSTSTPKQNSLTLQRPSAPSIAPTAFLMPIPNQPPSPPAQESTELSPTPPPSTHPHPPSAFFAPAPTSALLTKMSFCPPLPDAFLRAMLP